MTTDELKALKGLASIIISQANSAGWAQDDVARLLAEGTLILIEDYGQASHNPSLDEALNSGDGTYRP